MKKRLRRRTLLRTEDAGNAAVEVAILAPLFITFLAGLLLVMRVQHGSAVVAQAAADYLSAMRPVPRTQQPAPWQR